MTALTIDWREWPKRTAFYATFDQEQPLPHHHEDIYAQQLIEVLSDAVDILNEAKADGIILQFAISQTAPDAKYALTSLTATRPIIVPNLAANKDRGLEFVELLDHIGGSRELSLAKTKIEAVKHITRPVP